jgi:hypothetical protein
MKPITIRYRPISFIPVYRTVSGNFPENWNEISAAQLIAISCLYKGGSTDLHFLKTMTSLPLHVLRRTDDYERFKLMEQLEFIGERRASHEFIIKSLPSTRPMLQALCPALLAPAPKLKAVTFGQFIFADTYFSNYQETQNDDDLNKFITSLYLPKNTIFNENLINLNYKPISRINRNTREAIAINYSLIREWLSLAYPLIFQKRNEMISEAPSPEQRSVSKADTSLWIKIFQNFVGDDILHNDDWANQPINTIFQYMTRKHKENARRKN